MKLKQLLRGSLRLSSGPLGLRMVPMLLLTRPHLASAFLVLTASPSGSERSVSTDGRNSSVESAVEAGSASTAGGKHVARNVEGVESAPTDGGRASAKIATGAESARMGDARSGARSARHPPRPVAAADSACMGGRSIIVRNVVAAGSARTVGTSGSVRSAAGREFAATVGRSSSARSAVDLKSAHTAGARSGAKSVLYRRRPRPPVWPRRASFLRDFGAAPPERRK